MKRVNIILLVFMMTVLIGCQKSGHVQNGLEKGIENPIEPVNVNEEDTDLQNLETPIMLEVSANQENHLGVDVDSGFILVFNQALTEEEVREMVRLEPRVSFTVEKTDEMTYQLTPKNSLDYNRVYTLLCEKANYSYEFTTADALKLLYTTVPADTMTLTSGLSLDFGFNTAELSNFEECFSIYPVVETEFVYHDNVVTVLLGDLDKEINYNVQIDAGLTDGFRTTKSSYKWQFYTVGDRSNASLLDYAVINVEPDEKFGVRLLNQKGGLQCYTKIYQAKDFDEFYNTYDQLLWGNARSLLDMTLIDESDRTIYTAENIHSIEVEGLSEGYYILEIPNRRQYAFVQVGYHQIYTASLYNGNVYWVLDTENDEPVLGAEIYIGDTLIGTTDDSGVAFIEGAEFTYYDYVSVQGDKYLLNSNRDDYYYLGQKEDNYSLREHWAFFYTDKVYYRPGDEIKVFGFVKGFDHAPKHIKLAFDNWNKDLHYEIPITLDEHMTFMETVEIPAYWEYGWLSLIIDGHSNFTQYIYFMPQDDFMDLEVEMNSIALLGDEILYNLKAPNEPNTIVNLNIDWGESFTGKTNENGELSLPLDIQFDFNQWMPLSKVIRGEVDGNILPDQRITLFPRDVMIQSSARQINQKAEITLEMHHIDLSDFYGEVGYDYEKIKGMPYDGVFEITVTDRLLNYEPRYGDYSPLYQGPFPIYDYNLVNEDTRTISGIAENGMAKVYFYIEENHTYEFKIQTKDTHDRTVIASEYLWIADKDENFRLEYSNDYVYSLGEYFTNPASIDSDLLDSIENDLYLNLFMRNGLLEYEVTKSSIPSFEFKPAYMPDIQYKFVFFDGDYMHIYPRVDSIPILYEYTDLKRTIKVDHKTYYEPGETITLDVEVDSDVNGTLNFCLIDQAHFNSVELAQPFNLGEALHGYVRTDGITTDSTTNDERYLLGHLLGDGFPDIQTNIPWNDVSYMETVDVVEGKAKITLTLPELKANWRLNLLYVNKDLEYATKIINLITE